MCKQILLASMLLSFNLIYTMAENLDHGLDARLELFSKQLNRAPGAATRIIYNSVTVLGVLSKNWTCAVRQRVYAGILADPDLQKITQTSLRL